ncbi:D-lactate dehydrogenase [Aspergillus arachidicola]|uniref:D-lactate dehydrogenase (cytochrome) n=1 Tax=Aspergillus arachidicola TaxID=656916 RepID=A0A2G7G7S4_9EURO|nr:D-lactate dehydrogenase [Aspergillus arachidicola]
MNPVNRLCSAEVVHLSRQTKSNRFGPVEHCTIDGKYGDALIILHIRSEEKQTQNMLRVGARAGRPLRQAAASGLTGSRFRSQKISRPLVSRVFMSVGPQGGQESEYHKQGASSHPLRRQWTTGVGIAVASSALLLSGLTGYYLGIANPPEPAVTSTTPLNEFPAPCHDTSSSNIQGAVEEFIGILGKDNVISDKEALAPYSTSEWSSYSPSKTEVSSVVVCPSTTKEVSRVMEICHRRRLPVTAYAGGTSLEGHFAPTRGGVCVDFQGMDQILTVHKDDLDVVVQPAVQWEVLNEELAKDGLFFPPDPGPGAMIGGMVGTGCSGTNAYHYGTMRDWVLSLTVVLADGTIIKTRQRPRKSSAGYDLTRIFIGSEGTLGLVTEATLKLAVKPMNEAVAVASFPSVHDAASCVSEVVKKGVNIAAVELLDDVQMKCINTSQTTSRSWDEAPTLFFKFSGAPGEVKEKISIVQELAENANKKTFTFARNSEEVGELWSARKVALWSILQMKQQPTDHVWTTDVAVPMSRLPDIIEQTREEISASGLLGGIVGHVGDGNFHAMLLFNDDQRQVAEGVVHNMVKRAVEMEGTVTGEHGVGMVKRDYLEHEVGKTTVDTMRRFKQALDPLCLLNCDKVVRVQVPKQGEVPEW